MVEDAELEKLKTRVRTEGLGPLNDMLNPVVDTGLSMLQQGVEILRQSAKEHPLIALMIALQAGYYIGKMGRQHAHR